MSSPTAAPTIAKDLQDASSAWLGAGAEFDGIPIVGRREKDIANDIQAAVAKLGICIYVFPGLPITVKDVVGPYCDRYEQRMRVIEDVTLNTTKPDAYELTEYVIRRMHNQEFPDAIPGMNPFHAPESGKLVTPIEDEALRIFDIRLETSLGYPGRKDFTP